MRKTLRVRFGFLSGERLLPQPGDFTMFGVGKERISNGYVAIMFN